MENNSNLQHSQSVIKVYGADWCSHTRETISHLDQIGLKYQYINVEENAKASDWVKDQNDGLEIKPTLDVGGDIITAPSNTDLDNFLHERNLYQ
jgi:glutaredoxin